MALPGGTLALDWSVANCGLSSVGGKITDKIYLASDENPEGLRLLLSVPSAVSDLDVDQSQAFSATVTLPSDLEEGTWYLIVRTDVDGQVLESDYDNNASTVGFVDVRLSLPATVVGRWVFYNDSALDGHTPGAADADDNAIATDKQCLRYDETPSSINRTGSSRGINGVMIDIAGLPAGNSLSSDDFDFYRNDPGAGWVEGPVPSIVSVRRGAGVDGSDRVTLIWDPGQAVVDGWLGVAVLYTEATGLEEEDDFAFGNLRGDVNADGIVDQADYTLWYNSYGSMGGSGDVNFDGIVDQADYTLWYNSYGSTLADPYQPSGETATPTATVTAGGTASAQVAAAQGGNKTVDSSGPADVLALASTTTNPPTCGTTNRVPNRATPVPAAFERASATAEVLTRHRIRATMPSGGPPALEVDLLGPAAAPSLQLLP